MKQINKALPVKETQDKSKRAKSKKFKLDKRTTLVLLAVLLLVVAGLVYSKNNKQAKDTTQLISVCSEDSTTETCLVLKEAVDLLDPSKVKELLVVVDKIKNINGYDKNPSLLYIVLTYYLNVSDGENAKKTYELLNNSYKTDVGYDPLLVNAKKPAELESIINFLQKLSADVKKNSFTVPPEPQ